MRRTGSKSSSTSCSTYPSGCVLITEIRFRTCGIAPDGTRVNEVVLELDADPDPEVPAADAKEMDTSKTDSTDSTRDRSAESTTAAPVSQGTDLSDKIKEMSIAEPQAITSTA